MKSTELGEPKETGDGIHGDSPHGADGSLKNHLVDPLCVPCIRTMCTTWTNAEYFQLGHFVAMIATLC